MLAAARPTLQAVLQFSDDIGEIGDRSLFWLQYIYPLDRVPELALFLEVEPVTLLIAFNEHPEKAKQELQILFAGFKRERVDGEVARFLADVEVRSAKDRSE